VYFDETQLHGKRKKNVGRVIEDEVWFVAGIQRDNNRVMGETVWNDRRRVTVIEKMKSWISTYTHNYRQSQNLCD
jgi:hypothetical protein